MALSEGTYRLNVPLRIFFPKTKKTEDRRAWKTERDDILKTFKRFASALANTKGGTIWVQINGIHPSDRSLAHFHELVDDRLNKMIPDGTLFVNMCKISWASEGEVNTGLVKCYVSPLKSVATCDYKTKEPLDDCMLDHSSCKIDRLVKDGLSFKTTVAKIRGIPKDPQECRDVQMKALVENSETPKIGSNEFIQYLWKDLKLRYSITAFSKIDRGGSFYLGIIETFDKFEKYKSKTWIVTGFHFAKHLHSDFVTSLKSKVLDETVILSFKNGKGTFINEELIEVMFHPVDEDNDLYVLEVAVAAVEGIVFYDKEGPEAYEVDETGEIRRMAKEEWYRRQHAYTVVELAEKTKHKEEETLEQLTTLLDSVSLGGQSLDSDNGSDTTSRRSTNSRTSDRTNTSSITSSSSESVHTQAVRGAPARQDRTLTKRLRDIINHLGLKRKGIQPVYTNDQGPVYTITGINGRSPLYLQCSQLKIARHECNVSEDGTLLVNIYSSGQDNNHVHKSTTAFPLSPDTGDQYGKQYWEMEIEAEREEGVYYSSPLAEGGVGEHDGVDTKMSLKKQLRAVSICIVLCDTHRPRLCTQIWFTGVFVKCLATAETNKVTRTFGILLDTGNKLLFFTDGENGKCLYEFGISKLKNSLGPVMSVSHLCVERTVKIRLISGSDVVFTLEKQKRLSSLVCKK